MICVQKPGAKLLLLTALVLRATSAFSSEITLPDQSASSGATTIGQVSFASQSSFVTGVQFDVQYDNSAISLDATLGDGTRKSHKSLYAVDLAPNRKRFLIIGLNQAPIPDGILLTLSINVHPAAPAGVYALMVSNLDATDASGNAVAVTGRDGAMTVTAGTARLETKGVLSSVSPFLG